MSEPLESWVAPTTPSFQIMRHIERGRGHPMTLHYVTHPYRAGRATCHSSISRVEGGGCREAKKELPRKLGLMDLGESRAHSVVAHH